MAWLQRIGIGKVRTDEHSLQEQVGGLRVLLAKCRDVAVRRRHFYRELLAAIGVLMFTVGLVVGLYHTQITQGLLGLWARNADAGYAAFEKGKYETALKILRPLAENGDPRAESTLGLLYYNGGRGVQQDDVKAVKWFRLAANHGDAVAEFNLGVMYADGQGVPQDNAEAVNWYRLAAEQGNARAQYNLGLWYARGLGGSPDLVRAHMWFNLAASHFPASDPIDRNLAINNRDVVAGKMTSAEIAEAQRLALAWKPK